MYILEFFSNFYNAFTDFLISPGGETLLASLTLSIPVFIFQSIWNFGGESGVERDGEHPADLVVMNARVFTSDEDNPDGSAVAVEGERITYVGDNDGVADYIGPNTRVVNAKGKMLTPGFVDNHSHALWVSALKPLMTIDLYPANSLDEVKRIIVDYADNNPHLPFVMGMGWRYDYISGGLPDMKMADDIISDRPLILWSYDGHTGWLNSKAYKIMSERNSEALNKFGQETDDKTDEPTGVFHEFYSINPFDYFEEELGTDIENKMINSMKNVMEESLSYGVTTFNDAMIHLSFIPMILEFKKRGGLDNIRVRGSYYIHHHMLRDEEEFRENLSYWRDVGEKNNDFHLNLGQSVKLGIDGTQQNHTAFLFEPYNDMPDYNGHSLWTQEDFNRIIEIIDGEGIQTCTHAIGDAGINMVINAYEYAQKTNGKRDARHRVDHCELVTFKDIERMAKFDIYAAMQPCHFYGDESTDLVIDDERLQRLMPWRSLEKAGVELSFGSDWCAGPMNPIYGILVAGLRLTYNNKSDWGPEEKIEVPDIIRHYTIDSARALCMEENIGSLEVGKFGDFVLWDVDLFDLTSWWFLLTHDLELGAMDDFVNMTVVGGEIVYHKEGEKF